MSMPDNLCVGTQCFSPATLMVVPQGKWKNMPSRPSCRQCAGGIARAYTSADKKGWAEVFTLSGKPSAVGPIKTPAVGKTKNRKTKKT